MLKPEQVPDEVWKAAEFHFFHHEDWAAAIAAALNAWPLKTIHNDHLHWPEYPHIILPLPPQEASDAL